MTDVVTDAPVLDLDPEKIGDIIIRLGLLSHALGHDNVQGTLNPYLNHPELLSPEGWFVHDLLTHDTRRFIDRWYGGVAGALDMNAGIAARLRHLHRTDRPYRVFGHYSPAVLPLLRGVRVAAGKRTGVMRALCAATVRPGRGMRTYANGGECQVRMAGGSIRSGPGAAVSPSPSRGIPVRGARTHYRAGCPALSRLPGVRGSWSRYTPPLEIRPVQQVVEHAVVDDGARLDPVLPLAAMVFLVIRVRAGDDIERGHPSAHAVEDAQDGMQEAGQPLMAGAPVYAGIGPVVD